MELRWIASASASCMYAAMLAARGEKLVDADLAAALEPAAEELIGYCAQNGLDAWRLFDCLVPLASGIDNNQQLATSALQKCAGRDRAGQAAVPLARHIAQLESAFTRIKPNAADELALRAEPLRQQWEARGPGLLKTLTDITDDDFVTAQAQVALVHPISGGGGAAYPPINIVVIEAVLADPHADMPEVVRLAWLLAQLNFDLPVYQGELTRDRLALVGSLALVPAVLEAASGVELAANDETSIRNAISYWRISLADCEPVITWWQTYRSSSIGWTAALAALDRMLS